MVGETYFLSSIGLPDGLHILVTFHVLYVLFSVLKKGFRLFIVEKAVLSTLSYLVRPSLWTVCSCLPQEAGPAYNSCQRSMSYYAMCCHLRCCSSFSSHPRSVSSTLDQPLHVTIHSNKIFTHDGYLLTLSTLSHPGSATKSCGHSTASVCIKHHRIARNLLLHCRNCLCETTTFWISLHLGFPFPCPNAPRMSDDDGITSHSTREQAFLLFVQPSFSPPHVYMYSIAGLIHPIHEMPNERSFFILVQCFYDTFCILSGRKNGATDHCHWSKGVMSKTLRIDPMEITYIYWRSAILHWSNPMMSKIIIPFGWSHQLRD